MLCPFQNYTNDLGATWSEREGGMEGKRERENERREIGCVERERWREERKVVREEGRRV